MYNKGKGKGVCKLFMEIYLTTTECHLPYGITQCYLPSDTSKYIVGPCVYRYVPEWPKLPTSLSINEIQ